MKKIYYLIPIKTLPYITLYAARIVRMEGTFGQAEKVANEMERELNHGKTFKEIELEGEPRDRIRTFWSVDVTTEKKAAEWKSFSEWPCNGGNAELIEADKVMAANKQLEQAPTEPARRAAGKILEVAGKNEHYCPPDAVLEEIIDREFEPAIEAFRELVDAIDKTPLGAQPFVIPIAMNKARQALSLLGEEKKGRYES